MTTSTDEKTVLDKAIEALTRIIENPDIEAQTILQAISLAITLERNGLL